MLSRMRALLGPTSLLTIVLCAGVALVMSALYRDHAVKAAVPVIFLLALVPAAHIAGRMASLVVTIVAGFIFAACLFEPYGSLAIRSAVDQLELLCVGFAAIGMVYFSPTPRKSSGDAALSSFSGNRGTIKTSDLETWIAIVGYAVGLMAIVTLLLSMWK
jgi:K+-sensing histidine kinase KdpD